MAHSKKRRKRASDTDSMVKTYSMDGKHHYDFVSMPYSRGWEYSRNTVNYLTRCSLRDHNRFYIEYEADALKDPERI